MTGRSVRAYDRINEAVPLQVCWESKPEMERTGGNASGY